jgi:hypothetical protein
MAWREKDRGELVEFNVKYSHTIGGGSGIEKKWEGS